MDFFDESVVLTADVDQYHILKHDFKVPFVCGAKNLGEALRRVGEGASMIRTKGEAGTGNVIEAVRHARTVLGEIKHIQARPAEELMTVARDLQAPYELVRYVHEHGKLPVVNFAAGGVATPADAALMMLLGLDGVFVGSGIFKSDNPERRAQAIVKAVTHFQNADVLAEISEDLGAPMTGINIDDLIPAERLAARGW